MSSYENQFMAYAMPIIEMYADGVKGPRFYNACSDMFNYSQDIRPNKLLGCSPKSLQPIGCAFAIMAIEIDFGNPTINAIAAENAVYCLLTSYKNNPGGFGNIPFNGVVSLLLSDPALLHDGLMHLTRFHMNYLFSFADQVTYRSVETAVRSRILKYMIPEIFDLDRMDFKIDDLPLEPPKGKVIEFVQSPRFKADAKEGKELLEELYDFCKQGVSVP